MWGNHCHKMQKTDYLEDKVRGRFLARDTQASRTVSMFSNYNCMGGFISLYWFIKPLFIKLNWGTFLYMCHIFFLKEDDKGKMNVWVTEWFTYFIPTWNIFSEHQTIWQSLSTKLISLSSKKLSHSSPPHSDYLLLCSHGTDCLGLSLALKWICLIWNASRPFPCSFSGFHMCMLCLPAYGLAQRIPLTPFYS